VDRAIEWAAAHGADQLKLWADDTNPTAARFYESLGFRRTGEKNRPVGPGSPLRESNYERPLAEEQPRPRPE
jgi:hypothetical protein